MTTPTITRLAGMLDAMARDGIGAYVANEPAARMRLIPAEPVPLPCVVNDGDSHRCFATSPSCHYLVYASDELARKSGATALDSIASFGLRALQTLLPKGDLDRVVLVNEWMLSTNPLPSLTRDQVHAITRNLARDHPDHALVFRLVERERGPLASHLEAAGWQPLPAKFVYFWDPRSLDKVNRKHRQNVWRDIRLVETLGFSESGQEGIPDEALVRHMHRIHHEHSIGKQSPWNMELTPAWFQGMLGKGRLACRWIGRDSHADTFMAWIEETDRLTALVSAYDLTKDDPSRLFRAMFGLIFHYGHHRQKPVFLSAGTGDFKRRRGAQARWELDFIYSRHLPRRRHWDWAILRNLYSAFAGPVCESGRF